MVAMVIEGKSYADVIQAVKNNGKPQEFGNVFSIRKGKCEKAVIRVKGDNKTVDEVVKTLTGKQQGVKVGKLGRPPKKVFVTVKDLEFDAKGDDAVEAIEKVTNKKCLGVPVLRPAYGQTQVARVSVTDRGEGSLCENKRIRVGYVLCRVIRNELDEKCYRCQERGHIAIQCKGPDRRNDCFWCGEKGHKAADCKGEDGNRHFKVVELDMKIVKANCNRRAEAMELVYNITLCMKADVVISEPNVGKSQERGWLCDNR